MNGMVSVIIPVYNRQDYIAECLQSVLGQSYQNLEIVIIDDGSTDHTADICRHLAQEDPRIKLIEGMHKGVSNARNLGLDMAQGQYVFFIDSDDIIHPMLLEYLVNGLREYGANIGGTQCASVLNEKWSTVKEKFLSLPIAQSAEYLKNADSINAMLTSMTPINMIGGVIMERAYIADTRFLTDLSIGEDYYFIYQNLIKGGGALFLKQKWYLNRIHSANTSWDYGYTGFMTRLLRRKLVWQSEEQLGRTENADRQKREMFAIYSNCVKHIGVFHSDAGKMRKELRRYSKTILPAMSFKVKIAFLAAMYLPVTMVVIHKIKR